MNNLLYNQRFHFGAYGVLMKDGALLLIKKSRGPYQGTYDLPGGGVEFGEKAEEALRREFEEEAGISLDACKFINYNEYFSEYQDEGGESKKMHHVGLYYQVSATFESIKNEADGQDSAGAELINIQDLYKIKISPIAEPMIKLVLGSVN